MKAVFHFIMVIGLVAGPLAEKVIGNGAVCLVDSTDIQIKNNLTATVKVYKTLAITSEAGASFAEVTVPINDFIEISDIKGYTILPDGRRIRLKSSDIQTASAAEIREFGGYRVVMISMRSPVAGAWIHYEYTLRIKSLLYLPRIVRRERCEVRRFVVRVRWQKKVELRYDFSGLNLELLEREARFFEDNLKQISSEPNTCPDRISLVLGAEEFRYGERRYRSRTWGDVGYFYLSRVKDSEQSLREAYSLGSRLVRDSRTPTDTIRAIFDFVADSVSYVALELGKSDFDPHTCDLIMQRRFGDCKDQAALLSTLYRGVGIDAYPALVATGGYPFAEDCHPWPAFFDHVAVVIKNADGDFLLDPSEPHPRGGYLPARLRGRYYLVADGQSSLRQLPAAPEPSTALSWRYIVNPISSEKISGEFEIEYINDAAIAYSRAYADKNFRELSSLFESSLREAGWHAISAEIDSMRFNTDTLSVIGRFLIQSEEIGAAAGMAVGSPILEYLLKNIFTGVRRDDYCQSGSYTLKEMTRINFPPAFGPEIEEYDEAWIRDHLEFLDELSAGDGFIVYERTFNFQKGTVPPDDYNAFRDFILSIRNQRYVNMGR